MKLPSIQSLWDEFIAVVRRFPLQVLVTAIAVIVCFLSIQSPDIAYLSKLLVVCNFALTLLLSADLFAETHGFLPGKKWALRILVLVICALLYIMLHPVIYEADVLRMLMLAFAFHLLVSFSPFIGRGNTNSFWEYNKSLFLQVLTAGFYAVTLTVGLFIAITAVDALFDVRISSNVFKYVASLTMIGFMTIFFLSGVPKNVSTLDEKTTEYPRELKSFTQYVLIPIISIYLLILLAYEAKILVSWELPKGYVSMLILAYAVAGILSLLLIYPIRNIEGNGWIGIFSRFFYVMMLPLVVLLLLAVWKRVSVYGITESRYILIILAVWLTIVTMYNLLSRKENIKFIPISLCVLALLAIYGPQSAFSVSQYSQLNRLKKIYHKDDLAARKEKPEIITYLVKNHGLTVLQSFTEKDLRPLQDSFDHDLKSSRRKFVVRTRLIDTAIAILKVEKRAEVYSEVINVTAEKSRKITGYEYYVPIYSSVQEEQIQVGQFAMQVNRPSKLKLGVKVNRAERVLDIAPFYKRIKAAYQSGKLALQGESYNTYKLPAEGMDIPFETNDLEGVFRLTDIYISMDDEPGTQDFSGYFLLRLKTTQ